MKTTTTWKAKHHFESHQEHHSIQIDGSKEEGISPKALLLSALAGCSGIDVVDILQKMKVSFSSMSIDVATEQTTEHPRVFRDIHITYRIASAKENEEKIRKAIDLSLEKYCGVSAMLRKNSPIHYKLELS